MTSIEIQKTFDDLEKKYSRLLQDLNSMTDDALYFKAGADKWSIVEVIEHLVLAEENMLEQLTSASSALNLDPRDRSAKNYHIVIKVMTNDIAVDVPDESMEPRGQFSLEDLLVRWKDTRQKTRAYIEGIHPEKAGDLVYRHPFAGPLDISETLRFIDVHFDNHRRHIDKIKALKNY
ncbi:MAG: DinB family protein [Desulfobacterales bacterium]|jgi:hypothetical protein